MARTFAPGRHRVLVLASLAQCCPVCQGRRAVQDTTTAGPVPCPHCLQGLPVVHLPMYQDTPRGTPA
jgi:hypothetical protein